jgi:hypothetical protein
VSESPFASVGAGERVTVFADGARHPFALARLREALGGPPPLTRRLAEVAAAADGVGFVVAAAAELDEPLRRSLDLAAAAELVAGGYLLRTAAVGGRPTVLLVGGDAAGVVYAVQELAERGLARTGAAVALGRLDVRRRPALPYRMFWTWDHSTNWYLEQPGLQEVGAANYYSKPAEGFVADYTRLIDFMSQQRLNGLVVYGFLRDGHGGVEAAKEIARRGRERGVRVIPGVGINSYGGVYWEGEHRYNLGHWLRANPHLRARLDRELWFPMSHYGELACPSKPENRAYHVEAIGWLCREFEIGGINFETGDYGICTCADCRARRGEEGRWSIGDVAELYPALFEAARSANPDVWLIAEAYFDNLLDREAVAPLAALPEDTVCQFCINRGYWPRVRAALTAERVAGLPRRTNVLRTHMGSQWNRERYRLVGRDFADLARLATTTGLQGVDVFGEVSAFSTVNEINHLACAAFAYDGELTWERFVADTLGPRLGGQSEAAEYLRLLETPDQAAALSEAIGQAREIAADLSDDEQHRRWSWLTNRLYQKRAMLVRSA